MSVQREDGWYFVKFMTGAGPRDKWMTAESYRGCWQVGTSTEVRLVGPRIPSPDEMEGKDGH